MKDWFKKLHGWSLQWANTKWGAWSLFICAFADAFFIPLPTPLFFSTLTLLNIKKANKYAWLATLGTLVIVDASGEALKHALQEGVFLIKPNVREFRELVGLEIKDEQQIRAEAEKLVKSGQCQVIVISLGASGALVVSEEFIELK